MLPHAATIPSSRAPVRLAPAAVAAASRIMHPAARTGLAILFLFAVWTLCSPYFEVDRSSLIYTARAWADLDPTGVGRDVMFRLDGQAGFTLFTGLYRGAAAALGPAAATMTISVASIVISFLGVFVLARAMCTGRARVLAVVFAAALPACYGGFKIFSFAETAATPRPFAEALVLCCLAALLDGRRLLAVALLAGAALLHPIMALPGALVLWCWLISVDRRWLLLAGLGLVLALGVAVSDPAVGDRLVTLIDPTWKTILAERDPHLFPTLWADGWIGRFAARIATLVIGAALSPPPVRKLIWLTLAVGLAGFTTAYLCNERLPVVLLVQAQTWRAMWLVFALATLCAATCTMELWARGGACRAVLALLALSWVYADQDRAALVFAAAAVAVHLAANPRHYILPARATMFVIACAAALVVLRLCQTEYEVAKLIGDTAADFAGEARRTLAIDWDYTPVAIVAAVCVMIWRGPMRLLTSAGLVAGCLVLLAWSWDRRSGESRYFDAHGEAADLRHLTDSRPGEIFWIGGVRESWSWLARPQWLSPIQGAGLVFSRPLAVIYEQRAQKARDAGLDDGSILEPYADLPPVIVPEMASAKIGDFCAAPDAPAWIVTPLAPGQTVRATLRPTIWIPPFEKLAATRKIDGTLSWRRISRYAIIPCGGLAPAGHHP